jgi:hypothetical protein
LLTPTPKSMTLGKSKQKVWFRGCCLNFIFVLCNLHRHVPCRHLFRHEMVIFLIAWPRIICNDSINGSSFHAIK